MVNGVQKRRVTVLNHKENIESEMSDENFNHNECLNQKIEYGEIEKVVKGLKPGKSCGYDNIPNEILRQENVMLLLFHLFNKCFDFGKVPTTWLKSIIVPIPKKFNKRPKCSSELQRHQSSFLYKQSLFRSFKQ